MASQSTHHTIETSIYFLSHSIFSLVAIDAHHIFAVQGIGILNVLR